VDDKDEHVKAQTDRSARFSHTFQMPADAGLWQSTVGGGMDF
jgi:hypothetical protein